MEYLVLKGIGAKLKKYISETKTPKENWKGVVEAYESVGQSEIVINIICKHLI